MTHRYWKPVSVQIVPLLILLLIVISTALVVYLLPSTREESRSRAQVYSCSGQCVSAGICNSANNGTPITGSCSGGQTCCSFASQQVCTPGHTRCSGSSIQTCNSSGTDWVTTSSCPTGQTCDSASVTCKPVVTTVTPPPASCQSPNRCVSSGICNSANGGNPVSGACQTGQTCCSFAATQVCTPNHSRCSGNNIQTCNTAGTDWVTTSSCPTGQTCDSSSVTCKLPPTLPQGSQCGGALACDAGLICSPVQGGYYCIKPTCTESLTQCSGSYVQQCQRGQWTNIQSCDGGCNSNTKQCNEISCIRGQTKCSLDLTAVETCNADQTAYVKSSCTYGCQSGACKGPLPTTPPPVISKYSYLNGGCIGPYANGQYSSLQECQEQNKLPITPVTVIPPANNGDTCTTDKRCPGGTCHIADDRAEKGTCVITPQPQKPVLSLNPQDDTYPGIQQTQVYGGTVTYGYDPNTPYAQGSGQYAGSLGCPPKAKPGECIPDYETQYLLYGTGAGIAVGTGMGAASYLPSAAYVYGPAFLEAHPLLAQTLVVGGQVLTVGTMVQQGYACSQGDQNACGAMTACANITGCMEAVQQAGGELFNGGKNVVKGMVNNLGTKISNYSGLQGLNFNYTEGYTPVYLQVPPGLTPAEEALWRAEQELSNYKTYYNNKAENWRNIGYVQGSARLIYPNQPPIRDNLNHIPDPYSILSKIENLQQSGASIETLNSELEIALEEAGIKIVPLNYSDIKEGTRGYASGGFLPIRSWDSIDIGNQEVSTGFILQFPTSRPDFAPTPLTINIDQNLTPVEKFVTLLHETGHQAETYGTPYFTYPYSASESVTGQPSTEFISTLYGIKAAQMVAYNNMNQAVTEITRQLLLNRWVIATP